MWDGQGTPAVPQVTEIDMATAKQTGESSDLAQKIDRVRDNVKQFTSSASETAVDGVNSLVDQGADGVKAVANSVPQVSHWADEQLDAMRDRVRAEPMKMMAIAAGVGAIFGVLFLRR